MNFTFGIDKEAEIYCTSVLVSMKKQQTQVDNVTSQTAKELMEMGIEQVSYHDVLSLICDWTEKAVTDSGWSAIDEDGVAWFMGLYCKSYVRSLIKKICPFEQIFKDCFILYFKDK